MGGRRALLKMLAISLIGEGKITTTETKAKELRPFVEKLITKAKNNSLSSRRLVGSRIGNNEKAVLKLFSEIAPKYKDRNGGYTRLIKMAPKRSGHPIAVIELI